MSYQADPKPSIDVGALYADDELEFLRAIDRYKAENRRPFPTWREVLTVLKSLGYKKKEVLNDTVASRQQT
jgi:hypothetical protein